jgi:hypothetical protein
MHSSRIRDGQVKQNTQSQQVFNFYFVHDPVSLYTVIFVNMLPLSIMQPGTKPTLFGH